jgi:hypothetical protein
MNTNGSSKDEVRDQLPHDLDVSAFVGPYQFPDNGFAIAAVCLAAIALFVWSSSWKMTVNETEALVCASRAVDFAVGHASAQQVWRGLRSRPTWRVFCYSAEEPPRKRALVLVDAVDASIVEQLVEANPDKV